jgi:hypothetical protein
MKACGSTTRHPASASTPTVVVTSTPIGGFPTFSDWRVVYADQRGQLHAISTDGKNDAAGPMLPGLTQVSLGRPSISSTGRYLAYRSTLGVSIIDLTGQQAPIAYKGFDRGFAWSLDGSDLAVGGFPGGDNGLIHLPDQAIRSIPPMQKYQLDLIAWADSSHLAGYFYVPLVPTPGPSPTAYQSGPPDPYQTLTLGVEDLSTGGGKVIFSATLGYYCDGQFAISPDGRFAMLYNALTDGTSRCPDNRLIDVSTGRVTSLPHITQVTESHSQFTSIAWRPGTMMLAISDGDLHTWLIDAQHDTATALPYQGFIAGWAPDNGPLILTTGENSYGLKGPFTLSAVTDVGTTAAKETKLVDSAYHLAFGGCARTAS